MARQTKDDTGRKRLTVSFDEGDYERLKKLADNHRPRLTLQYVVEYSVQLVLERAQDPQFARRLGELTPREEIDGHS